ncbi:MAG: site-specific integrase [Terricaulis sp.]
MPRLGKRSVDGLAPAEKEYVVWDDELKGFGIRVRPSGAKTYVATYRHGRRFRWATIGKHGSPWTPESARLKANAILRAAGEGEDPAAGKSERRTAISVAELIDSYLTEGPVDKPNKRASTWSIDKSNLNRHVRVLLGTRIAAELTSTDLAEFQRDVVLGKTSRDEKTVKRGRAIIKGGAGTARRTLITLAAMLQWAVGRRIIRANPAKGVQLVKVGSRERFLTQAELVALLNSLDELQAGGTLKSRHASAIRLLIFTGCRKTEIIGLRWAEIDFDRKALALPDLRSKNGPKRVPLNSMAITELESLKRGATGEYVFPAERGEVGHTLAMNRIWRKVRTQAKMPDLRMHDLRHSFASFAVEAGESLYVLQRALGHKKAVTTQRYAHLRDDPVQAMVERVGERIQAARLSKSGPADPNGQ